MEADGGGLFLFHVVGGLGTGIGGGGDEAGVVSKLRRPSGALGLGGLPRRFGVAGIGGSRPPAARETKLISGVRPSPGCARARACNEAAGELWTAARAGDTVATLGGGVACDGGTEGAGPGGGVAAGPRYQRRLRGIAMLGGLCSGELTSGERSWPQGQRSPLLDQAPQRLRARIGAPQSKHIHMQNSAVRPHCPPPGLTWGHIFTLAQVFPQ